MTDIENDTAPTDPTYEESKGRGAYWLAPDDLRWLVKHLRATAEDND